MINPAGRRAHAEALAVAAAHGVVLDDESGAALRADARLSRSSSVDPAGLRSSAGRWRSSRSCARPLAFARSAGIATPTLDAIEALCVSLAASKGLYAL